MDYRVLYKRKLPHYQPRQSVFFVTFRLDFPIPEKYLLSYQNLKEGLRAQYGSTAESPDSKALIQKRLFAYTDSVYHEYDCGRNICAHPELATMIRDSILDLHEAECFLYAFTLMPNHVHMLIRPLMQEGKPVQISKIMQQLKGSTARAANLMLNRTGHFWNREYYDHWVRNQQELVNVIRYIRDNPLQAGLTKNAEQWPWTWINPTLWQD